jgi:hypothetical protein
VLRHRVNFGEWQPAVWFDRAASRRVVLVLIAWCGSACASGWLSVPTRAAIAHNYVSQITEIPSGQGMSQSGALAEVNGMTLNAGTLYLAERVGGSSRTDLFDAASGAFDSQFPQAPSIGDFESGVAVGGSTGETQVYVGATEKTAGEPGIVAVFGLSGNFLGSWSGEAPPSKTFGSRGVTGVAVDNSKDVGDWAAGDVYVSDITGGEDVVDVFKPEKAGKEQFVTKLTGISPTEPFSVPLHVAVSEANGDLVVVDGFETPVVDVFEPMPGMPGVYNFVRKITGVLGDPFERISGIAVDGGDGNIYVAEQKVVYELSSEGTYLAQITGVNTPAGNFERVMSVAVDPLTHDVYVGDERKERGETSVVDVLGADSTVPDVTTEPVSAPGARTVTVEGTVNPHEAGEASCQFAWGTTTRLEHTTACSTPIAEGNVAVPVQVTLSGLEPDTTYYYRLQATNANGTNLGEEFPPDEFTTLGPGLRHESALAASSTSATLTATINPHKEATSYYFQYGLSSTYGMEIPALTETAKQGATIGAGEGGVEVFQHLQHLPTSTTYHYRIVAVSELAPGQLEAFYGPDLTFTTEGVGGSLMLPDGRAWELVSPPNKQGSALQTIGGAGGVIQASAGGNAMTYIGSAPTEPKAHGYSNFVQVLSTHGQNGWSSRDIATPHNGVTPVSIGTGQEYRFLSEDLSKGLVEPLGDTLLSERASEQTLYLRSDGSCEGESELDECYRPLVTAKEGYEDVPPGTKFGPEPEKEIASAIHFSDASPDLDHVLIESTLALTPVHFNEGEGKSALYEWSADRPQKEALQTVSVLPENEGGAAIAGAELGEGTLGTRGAVSSDGRRVFWSLKGEGNSVSLYMRDLEKEETVRLDLVQGLKPGGEPRASFNAASADGSKVFFTDVEPLTPRAGTFGSDLYECEIVETVGKLECKLSNLTPANSLRENTEIVGSVLGTSADGSYVYFIANGKLAPGAVSGDCDGESGESIPVPSATCNLYVMHNDGIEWEAPKLVAVLSGEDYPDWSGISGGARLSHMTSRVSPNGRWLAFMSNRPLTGYDNTDVNGGHQDEEVFLYDSQSARLVCASCDPTGAKPTGIEYGVEERRVGGFGVWPTGAWLAANIPGWTPFELRPSRYQSRYLNNAGRLFFNSSVALVPQDINGQEDVYEYEPAGITSSTGTVDCGASSPSFDEGMAGCVNLVSSGTSADESAFLDASETGGDVFFLTSESLVPEDVDTAFDVYDAHECSASSPCVSAATPAPPCRTADSCRSAPLPQPSAFGAPSSATFSGAGNVAPSATVQATTNKSLTRAQKLARALSACRKQKRSKRRTVCERRARTRYGVGKPSKAKAKKRGRK